MDAVKKKKEKTKLDDDDDDSKPFPKKMKRELDGSVTPGATVLRPTDDDEEDLGGEIKDVQSRVVLFRENGFNNCKASSNIAIEK